jgi:hypothetical protein
MQAMFSSQTHAQASEFSPLKSRPVAVPEIPPVIFDSPLMRRGGFDVFSGVADEFIKNSLLAEAVEKQKVCTESIVTNLDSEEIRGGAPQRKILTSAGGEFQKEFYQSEWLTGFLRELTTPFLHPTGKYGTFSYYCRKNDFLDIHRDIVACDVAVITCLKNEFGEDRAGGKLCLYPERTGELLSAIRATPEKGACKISLEEGQTLVMYGGIVPHALLPVSADQTRIVSVLCYQAL